MFDNIDELAAQNECSKEEFNYKLSEQIVFIASNLQDSAIAIANSLIAQTEQGREIIKDMQRIQNKLTELREGLI